MSYLFMIVCVLVVLPFGLFLFSRGRSARPRAGSPGNTIRTEPAADEPTPASGAVNRITPKGSEKVPPA